MNFGSYSESTQRFFIGWLKLIICSKRKFRNDYIDVDDGCWKRNVLVTILRCWWFKRFHQDLNSVANILKLSSTVSHQHPNVTNMTVAFRNSSRMNFMCAIKDHVVHRYQSQWVNLVQNYWEPPKLNDSIHFVAIWHSWSGFAPKYRILLSYLWFNLAMGAARQTAQRPIWIDFSSLTRATCHSGRIRIATFF